jgi:hypothetical protein
MKLKTNVLFVCFFLLPMACAAKTVLPDACGDPKVNFEVKVEKDQPQPDAPPQGKAQVILIEDQNGKYKSFRSATVRYGLDGNWVGANYGDSYFPLTVDPGVHHLCVSWEGSKREVGAASFTAEAGKVYYFAAEIQVTASGGGGMVAPTMTPNGMVGGGPVMGGGSVNRSFALTQLSDDEGKYRVKAWKLATFRAKD